MMLRVAPRWRNSRAAPSCHISSNRRGGTWLLTPLERAHLRAVLRSAPQRRSASVGHPLLLEQVKNDTSDHRLQ
jgi:hypothetical protein